MERAAAMVLGGVGLVVLTLAAVVLSASTTSPRPSGLELAALTTAPAAAPSGAGGSTSVPGAAPSGAGGSTTVPGAATSVPPGDRSTAGSASRGAPAAGAAVTDAPAPRPARPAAPSAELAALLREISAGAIRFGVDRADLDATAQRVLDRLAGLLRAEPGVVVVVRGHTDSSGTPTINGPLSQRRAAAVVDYLVARGVPAARLVAEGVGPSEPVADNATPEGRQANRRSDVAAEGGD